MFSKSQLYNSRAGLTVLWFMYGKRFDALAITREALRIAAKVFAYVPPIGPAEYPESYFSLGKIQSVVRIRYPIVWDRNNAMQRQDQECRR
jgi:hypothetical protein